MKAEIGFGAKGIHLHQIAKTILKKKYKIGEYELPDFKTYYKNTVIMWYWHKGRQKNSEIENPEINLNIYGKLIFNKGIKTIQ